MKKLILIAAILLSVNCFAQNVLDSSKLRPKTFQYAKVTAYLPGFSSHKYQVTIDEGQYAPLEYKTLTDVSGKPAILNSVVDVINYMDNRGWELVSSTEDRDGGYSFFFRRKIAL